MYYFFSLTMASICRWLHSNKEIIAVRIDFVHEISFYRQRVRCARIMNTLHRFADMHARVPWYTRRINYTLSRTGRSITRWWNAISLRNKRLPFGAVFFPFSHKLSPILSTRDIPWITWVKKIFSHSYIASKNMCVPSLGGLYLHDLMQINAAM